MMKTLFLLLFSLTLFAAHIDNFAKEMNFHRDYNTALSQAKKENKMLVMVLGADYCPWCRKFENKTLNSALVKPYLQKEVITLVVDKKFDIESFPKKFTTQYTPRVFYINPSNEDILHDTFGYIKKKDFMKDLQKAQDTLKIAK
ncbi:MAG: thioredoxin family protein [Helicobacteraceae bacterium]|nr:thioredoxin family protein [Candidatus Sulfurimonas ponti]